jgi:hypothetical protein
MLRPKVAVGLAVTIVLLFLVLGGLHHQGRLTLPLSNLEDVIEWEDIEMPHEDRPSAPEETEMEEESVDSLSQFGAEVQITKTGIHSLLSEPTTVMEFVQRVPPGTSTTEVKQLPQPTLATSSLSPPLPDIGPINDSSVRIYIGVVYSPIILHR